MTRCGAGARKAILDCIARAADNREVCPSNEHLAAVIGAASTASAVRYLSDLEKEGFIEIQRYACSRIVRIKASGKQTAGQAGNPHWRDIGDGLLRPRLAPGKTVKTRSADIAQESPAVQVRVDREPCPRCGTRADIGCRHTTSGRGDPFERSAAQ